jgi:hypothetical protein
MRLEYFDDPSLQRPVLLLYGNDPEEATLLRGAVEDLADGTTTDDFRVESLPGFLGVDGCSLIAQVSDSNLGVELIPGSDRSFSCKLDAARWRHVWGLLEPFVDREMASTPNGFQYLDESDAIDWIISRSRSW